MDTHKHLATPPPPLPSRSRRERPAKPALTRQGIVAAALAILRDAGLEKVTMRRIAAALDTGPSSLYVYVRDTEDLHAQILDALLAAVIESPTTEVTWRDQLKQLLTRYVHVLFDYPEIARMTLTTHPSGPNYLALVERILALLREGGIPDREAAWAVDLLLLYATADAAEHGARKSSAHAAAEDSAPAAVVATADATTYPNIVRLGDELLSGGPARFQWGLDVFLTGALNAPRDSTKTETEQERS
ncbi:MAG TPA: TetR/AcrR family transcriptional regulator [Ktedonobacterales bacterium]|nr:TetR/AcrR family transcriptional regulator [Ktedonobacterales bacterium]